MELLTDPKEHKTPVLKVPGHVIRSQEEKEALCYAYFEFPSNPGKAGSSKLQQFSEAYQVSLWTVRAWMRKDWWKAATAQFREEAAEAIKEARRVNQLANQRLLIAQENAALRNSGKLQNRIGESLDDDLTPTDLQKLAQASQVSARTAKEVSGYQDEIDLRLATAGKSQIAIQQNVDFAPKGGGYGNPGDHPAESAILSGVKAARGNVVAPEPEEENKP